MNRKGQAEGFSLLQYILMAVALAVLVAAVWANNEKIWNFLAKLVGFY